jgi:hypothetical protein
MKGVSYAQFVVIMSQASGFVKRLSPQDRGLLQNRFRGILFDNKLGFSPGFWDSHH